MSGGCQAIGKSDIKREFVLKARVIGPKESVANKFQQFFESAYVELIEMSLNGLGRECYINVTKAVRGVDNDETQDLVE